MNEKATIVLFHIVVNGFFNQALPTVSSNLCYSTMLNILEIFKNSIKSTLSLLVAKLAKSSQDLRIFLKVFTLRDLNKKK
ncbi:hypothetical protein BpHYR1_050156 [Brachionus plicatilis]|uniref:Uncharacterized protein n=1 Tax=Brachionus plicatilis TaxID=10195 RepID=A0A3M7Q4X3_BRAPC|nr:hypothetical protein BpHYR1_050156 [Brachionus plicatilis]